MPTTASQQARVRAMYAHAGLPGAEMTLCPKWGVGFKRHGFKYHLEHNVCTKAAARFKLAYLQELKRYSAQSAALI